MSRWMIASLLIAVVTMLGSCGEDSFLDRREFVDPRDEVTELMLHVDWHKYAEAKPTGMSVYVYADDGQVRRYITNDVDSIRLDLPLGHYRLMVFNLSTDEFGSLSFSHMDNFDSARVTLTPDAQVPAQSWDGGATYLRDPELLYVARDTVDYSSASAVTRASSLADTLRYAVTVAPRPVVSRLIIRVKVEDIRGLRSVVGNISGFSSGYYIGGNSGTDSTGTQLLDNWKVTVDSVGASNGYVTTSITTFGLPPADSQKAAANVLKLAFKMADNTIRVYKAEVGDKFEVVTDDGKEDDSTKVNYQVTLLGKVSDIKLPDVKPVDSGGFSAEVDDWDNGGDYDITF